MQAGRVYAGSGENLGYIRYVDDFPAAPISNSWSDTYGQGQFGGDKVYVVQSATKVIERSLLMCTDPGDLVLDPTCGSGTTAYAAEQWGTPLDHRRHLPRRTGAGPTAAHGCEVPLLPASGLRKGRAKESELAGQPLPQAPTRGDIRHWFVNERVQHITLKSIAKNPDIKEGMTRDQIDAAIKRHADFETLYDRPHEDKQAVRVTGPFTIESLSPHRSLAFAGGHDEAHRETISEQTGAQQPDAPTFEQSILANLARTGVQNGRRDERIEFGSTESYPGTFIQAMGESKDGARIAVAIGPQYGTVSQRFVKEAAREAIAEGSIDLLCVLGFAFDATAGDVTGDDNVTVDTSRDGSPASQASEISAGSRC